MVEKHFQTQPFNNLLSVKTPIGPHWNVASCCLMLSGVKFVSQSKSMERMNCEKRLFKAGFEQKRFTATEWLLFVWFTNRWAVLPVFFVFCTGFLLSERFVRISLTRKECISTYVYWLCTDIDVNQLLSGTTSRSICDDVRIYYILKYESGFPTHPWRFVFDCLWFWRLIWQDFTTLTTHCALSITTSRWIQMEWGIFPHHVL